MPSRILPRSHRNPRRLLRLALFVGVDGVWVSLMALAIWGIGQGHNWVNSTAELQPPRITCWGVSAIDLCSLSLGGALAAVLADWCATAGDSKSGAWVTFGIAALGCSTALP